MKHCKTMMDLPITVCRLDRDQVPVVEYWSTVLCGKERTTPCDKMQQQANKQLTN